MTSLRIEADVRSCLIFAPDRLKHAGTNICGSPKAGGINLLAEVMPLERDTVQPAAKHNFESARIGNANAEFAEIGGYR